MADPMKTPEQIAEEERALLEQKKKSLEEGIATLDRLKGVPATVASLQKSLEEITKTQEQRIEGAVNKIMEAKEKEWTEKFSLAGPDKMRFADPGNKDKGNGKSFSFARLIKSLAFNDPGIAAYEREVCSKALEGETGSAGGFLVPEERVAEIRDRITAQAQVRKTGPTVYPMATDTLNVPKVTGGATSYWIGQNVNITTSQQTFGNIQLVAKNHAVLVLVSQQLVKDGGPAAEAAIRRDIAKTMALGEDLAFIEGKGAANEPVGILNYPGIGSTSMGANGATPGFDDIYDALYQVEKNNGVTNFWLMHPRSKNTLRKIKDGQGRYIYTVSISVKEPDSLVGLPVFLTTQIPITLTKGSNTDNSYILCGQGDEALIGERAGMEFAIDQGGEYFKAYQVAIRVIQRVDFALRTATVFHALKDVRP